MPVTRSGAGAQDVLRALADPTRLRLFCDLRASERCVRDLMATQQLAQPLVSHHLGVLVRCGLVQRRRQGGFTMYAVDAEGMERAGAAVAELLDASTLAPQARPGGNRSCCR